MSPIHTHHIWYLDAWTWQCTPDNIVFASLITRASCFLLKVWSSSFLLNLPRPPAAPRPHHGPHQHLQERLPLASKSSLGRRLTLVTPLVQTNSSTLLERQSSILPSLPQNLPSHILNPHLKIKKILHLTCFSSRFSFHCSNGKKAPNLHGNSSVLKKSDNMSNLLGRKTETGGAGAVGQGELPEVTSFHELWLGYIFAWWYLLRSHETLCCNNNHEMTWSIFGYIFCPL